jgi:multiple sugar transport system substrate-binding protein
VEFDTVFNSLRQVLLAVTLLGTLTALSLTMTTEAADVVVIRYWQPNPGNIIPRDDAIDELIRRFEAENPDVLVEHIHTHATEAGTTDNNGTYINRIKQTVPFNQGGPHVAMFFYGWLADWADEGYLVPLPEEIYTTGEIDNTFVRMVSDTGKINGTYYGVPTAVRTMALFYNRDMFEAAGLNPDSPPRTLDEMVQYAEIISQHQASIGGDAVGFNLELSRWGHHWLREVLVPQFGGNPANNLNTIWNSAEACAAFTWVINLEDNPRTTAPVNDGVTRETEADTNSGTWFIQEKVAMHVDGPFRIASIAASSNPDLNYSVAPLPTLQTATGEVQQRTFGSYWMHGLTPLAQQDERVYDASVRFVRYITSTESVAYWVDQMDELPARTNDLFLVAEDELLRPFAEGMEFAYATNFVNEDEQKAFLSDAYNAVITEGEDPCEALYQAGINIQNLLEDYQEDQNRW